MGYRFPQELDLEARFPGWLVWVVPRVVGGPVWCARRRGAEVAEFNAATAEELAADLAGAT